MKLFELFTRDVLLFIGKVMLFYIVWWLLYDRWLLPDGRLDEWVSLNIVSMSAGLLDLLGFDAYMFNRVVGIDMSRGLEIIDGCNGLEAIGLFIGFIIAYPGDSIKKMLFTLSGIGIIYISNVFRITVLAVVQYYTPDQFGFTHDYTSNSIFYIVIFILWIVWANFSDSGLREKI